MYLKYMNVYRISTDLQSPKVPGFQFQSLSKPAKVAKLPNSLGTTLTTETNCFVPLSSAHPLGYDPDLYKLL